MLKISSLITVFIVSISNAQNVGIGTSTPAFPLDINGRARLMFNGATAGIWYNKADNSLPASFAGQINDTTYGIFDNTSFQWQFAFNHSLGNFGIGTTTPQHSLTFSNSTGDKISLWGGNANANDPHYGFGIQSGLLQVFTNSTAGDIAFGYGNSTAFTQNVRFKGDGNILVGGPVWFTSANDRVIRFGDGDFVHIGEVGQDDRMELKSGTGGFLLTGGRVGINTNPDPTARLFINGPLRLTDGTQATNKILSSDASGNASWKLPPYYNSYCEVYTTGAFAFSSNTDVRAPFNTEYSDDGNNFDAVTNYAYIAPAAGVYHFDISILWNLTGTAAHYRIRFLLGSAGNDMAYYADIPPNTIGLYSTNLSTTLKLAAGEQVPVFVFQNSGVSQATNGGYSSYRAYRVY